MLRDPMYKAFFERVGERVEIDGRHGTIEAVAVSASNGVPVYTELGGYFYIRWDDHGERESDAWEQKATGEQIEKKKW